MSLEKFELNVYGADGIDKTYKINKISYGLAKEALKMESRIKELKAAGQVSDSAASIMIMSDLIEPLILKLFPGLTADELERCELLDVFNTFKQLCNYAKSGKLMEGVKI